jgi:hypothetical protein
MRLQLAFALLVLGFSTARADDVTFRGNYWRDRNTRVLQPEVDFSKELPSGTLLGAHYLLDAITSASVAAGAISDQPFTEVRHEGGFRIGQRIKERALLFASYSYSSESDYRAHTTSVGAAVDLFQRNTTLTGTIAWGHNDVLARISPTSAIRIGGLDTVSLLLGVSQVLSKTALVTLGYELNVLGVGLSKEHPEQNGYQGNPYRPVSVQNSPVRESVPFERYRQSFTVGLHLIFPIRSTFTPFLAFRPSYRYYTDDWGVSSHTPELRLIVPTGPVEWRIGGRLYTQTAASFWNDRGDDVPFYPNGGKACSTCWGGSTKGQTYYTSDPKLSEFNTYYVDVRLFFRLGFLHKLGRFISNGTVELMYGRLFTERAVYRTFGDASVGGLEFRFPL